MRGYRILRIDQDNLSRILFSIPYSLDQPIAEGQSSRHPDFHQKKKRDPIKIMEAPNRKPPLILYQPEDRDYLF